MTPTRIALLTLAASVAIIPFAAATAGGAGAGTRAEGRGGAFCFGGWGDMPYTENGDLTDTVDKPANVVKSMNDAGIAFSIFNGDLKDGGSPCGYVDGVATDAFGFYQYTYDLFQSAGAPVVYTPGDNEWTDCHRESSDNDSASPLAMLDFTRDLFFGSVPPGGERFAFGGTKANQLKVQHQKGQVENARWMYHDVVFFTLHVVGSNNNNAVTEGEAGDKCGRDDVASCADQVDEYEARTVLNLEWMAEAFAWAKERSAKGVSVNWHANPGFDIQGTSIVEAETGAEDGSNGFTSTLSALWTAAKDFDGEVILVHGDSHKYIADQPFAAIGGSLQPLTSSIPSLDSFQRIIAPGSPTTNWVEICVNPSDDTPTLFSHRVVTVEANHDDAYFS